MSKKIRFKFYLPQEFQGWEAEEEWKPGRMDYEELELLHHFAESFVDIEREEIEEGEQC